MIRDANIAAQKRAKPLPQQRKSPAAGEGGALRAKTSPSSADPISCGQLQKRRRGAQPDNRQALKTGRYTAEKRELRRQISDFIRQVNALIALVDRQHGLKPPRKRRSR
jgi:hypothetical protein